MSNGDCPIGARHDEAIEELRRQMAKLESAVERACETIGRLETSDKVRTAELNLNSKIWVAVFTCVVGPIVVALAAHFIK